MLNLHAPIEPGRTAAGFQIGQHFSYLSEKFSGARIVEYQEGFNLNRAIKENDGVLVVKGFGFARTGWSVYFGQEAVRLMFSERGTLGCIYTFEGYLGSYRGIPLGSPLSAVSALEPISFDEGDEMYYRVDKFGEYLPGIAIVAAQANLDEHQTTPILGFCVHDWSVFHRGA